MQANTSFPNFRFQSIGHINSSESEPSLLKRLSADAVPSSQHGEQLPSPQSPIDASNDVEMSVSVSLQTSDSTIPSTAFSSVPSRLTLMQSLNPTQASNSSTRIGPKVDIFGQKFAFNLPSSNSENPLFPPSSSPTASTSANVSASDNVNTSTLISSVSKSAQQLANPSASKIDYPRASPLLSGSSDNLLYPSTSASQTPQRGHSPVIVKRESRSASASPATITVDTSSLSLTQNCSPAAIASQESPASVASSVQRTPGSNAFAMLKGMHSRLLSAVVDLNKQATSPQLPSSSSPEPNFISVSSNLTSARQLASQAQSLAQQSISSAQSALTALAASINEAKESLDAANKAMALVEASTQMLTAQEQNWTAATAQVKTNVDKIGEWILERERDRERRLQLAKEREREKEEKERREKELEEQRVQDEKERKAREAREKERQEQEVILRLRRENETMEHKSQHASPLASSAVHREGSMANSTQVMSNPSSTTNDLFLNLPNFDSVESLERHIGNLEAAVRRIREEAEKYKMNQKEKEATNHEVDTQNHVVEERQICIDRQSQIQKDSQGDTLHPEGSSATSSTATLPYSSPPLPASVFPAHLPLLPKSVSAAIATQNVVPLSEAWGKKKLSKKTEKALGNANHVALSGNMPPNNVSESEVNLQNQIHDQNTTPSKLANLHPVGTGFSSNAAGKQNLDLLSSEFNNSASSLSSIDARSYNVSSDNGNHSFQLASPDMHAVNMWHVSQPTVNWPGKNPAYRGYDIPNIKAEEEESRVLSSPVIRKTPILPARPLASAPSSMDTSIPVTVPPIGRSAFSSNPRTASKLRNGTGFDSLPLNTVPADSTPATSNLSTPPHCQSPVIVSSSFNAASSTHPPNKQASNAINVVSSSKTGAGRNSAPAPTAAQATGASYPHKPPVSAPPLRLRSPSPIAPHDAGWTNVQMASHRGYDHYSPSPPVENNTRSKSPPYNTRSSRSVVETLPHHAGSYPSRSSRRSRSPVRHHLAAYGNHPTGTSQDGGGQGRTALARTPPPPAAHTGEKRPRADGTRAASPPRARTSYPSPDHPVAAYTESLQDDFSGSLGSRLSNGHRNANDSSFHHSSQTWDADENIQSHEDYQSYPKSKRQKAQHDKDKQSSRHPEGKPGLLSRMRDSQSISAANSKNNARVHGGQAGARGQGRGRARGRGGNARNLSARLDPSSTQRDLADRLS
ncbi:hypothetical protein GYMLUDRAFT_86701 [Collybiopsis luxurians FD-317 M1]|uniref:Uncharacterized protein n=1 Tax=Collybiopsis luxurians FD-317 M1 TaxID=944289 RepID=A0A0D0C5M9_9AGAR|nr:hypothetical protein GYMLUDRAFT_86701 [Collybiopsis luxurians FD-317 M1]